MLLDGLTDQERALVEGIGTVRNFSEGQHIIREGETGDSIFVVLSGRVEIHKAIDAHRDKHLKELTEGDFFGEMSFFDGAARSAAVIARGTCRVLELPADALDALARENPAVGCTIYRNIARDLTRRIRSINDELKKAILWAVEGWTYAGP
jgi:CRP-like cAMP-binding protein